MREIRTEIEIGASVQRVWSVLTDLEDFGEWNPFIVRADGELLPGERLVLTMRLPGRRARTFRPTVLAHDPNRELRWLGRLGIPGIFDGEHAHRVQALPDGRTRYVQEEGFRGILVPFVGGILRATEEAFRGMNEALKTRAEAQS
ncbi:MAG TPA: SRPBCC domain-containing protein [Actinomycetota bacterium]|nr:SRPBCC domain-containing protein [Actinomycetota bacterium]